MCASNPERTKKYNKAPGPRALLYSEHPNVCVLVSVCIEIFKNYSVVQCTTKRPEPEPRSLHRNGAIQIQMEGTIYVCVWLILE